MLDDEIDTALLPSGPRQHQHQRHQEQKYSAATVRRRLSTCVLLYTVSANIMTQIIPKIILVSCGGDNSEASKYKGWMASAVSVIQLIFVPALSGFSDTAGRKALIYFALALHAGSVFSLASATNSLALATACRLLSSVSLVILPVSQAVMIDLSEDGGKGATHGLGIAFGAFALGSSAGDIVGGSLSERHRGVACVVSGALASAALVFLALFGWKETAPSTRQRRRGRWPWCWPCGDTRQQEEEEEEEEDGHDKEERERWGEGSERATGSDASAGNEAARWEDTGREETCCSLEGGGGRNVAGSNVKDDLIVAAAATAATAENEDGHCVRHDGRGRRRGTRDRLLNPVSVLTVFLENRLLLRIAFSYFLFVLSLNVFATGYNYLDYRFHWTPAEISYFFAAYNSLMGLFGGWSILWIVPKRLSEENGGLFGISVQACAATIMGFCFRGWMLYPALVVGALQNITEPCLQAVMATFVTADRLGGLQGAVTSLRVVGEGVAAPVFTQVFAAGSAAGFAQAPFFLAAMISLISVSVAWLPLRELDRTGKKSPNRSAAAAAAAAAGGRRRGAREASDTSADGRGGGVRNSEEASTTGTIVTAAGAGERSPLVDKYSDSSDSDCSSSTESGLAKLRSMPTTRDADGGSSGNDHLVSARVSPLAHVNVGRGGGEVQRQDGRNEEEDVGEEDVGAMEIGRRGDEGGLGQLSGADSPAPAWS